MDKYEKLRIVGRGAHGTVCLCTRLEDGKRVIVKEIPVESMSASERDAAMGEVKMLEMLRHPNIIGYYENFIEANALCIVMEFAQGGTLADFLDERKGCLLSEEEILGFFTQIALSLQHLHVRQILHRDLKTRNILLNKDKTVCKLSDFGISKMLSTKSKATTVIGTPSYLSPEICQNMPYNMKSDVWSLGCVLYELTTLKKAFDAQSLPAVVLKIVSGNVAPVADHYSDMLKELIFSMLSKSVDKRPTINEILAHPLLLVPLIDLMCGLGRLPYTRANKTLPKLPRSCTAPADTLIAAAAMSTDDTEQQQRFVHMVYAWGDELTELTRLPLPTVDTRVAQVCIGSMHKLALSADGRVITWEEADIIDCEPDAVTYEPHFVKQQSQIVVLQIACGDMFVACVSDRGILMTYGTGLSGCLGHGNVLDVTHPKIVEALVGNSVTRVACGARHILTLTSDGSVFAWGRGDNGRLGLGTSENHHTPQKVTLPSTAAFVKAVYCSVDASAVLTADGRAFAAGNNAYNKLALWIPEDSEKPNSVKKFTECRALPCADMQACEPFSLGLAHTLIISDGLVFTIGSNLHGQLGTVRDTKVEERLCQAQISPEMSSAGASRVHGGDTFSVAVLNDGSVIVWGKVPSEQITGTRAHRPEDRRPRVLRLPSELCVHSCNELISLHGAGSYLILAYSVPALQCKREDE